MNKIKITFLAVSVFLLSYGISNAQELFLSASETCNSNSGQGNSNSLLYRVNPNTGQTNLVGPIGFNGVGALAQIGDGRLIAGARADANGDKISILIEIDPGTGQGTLIGTVGSDSGPGCGRIGDLTYDPATDTLYGLGFQCEPGLFDGKLLAINPNTAEATDIGDTGFDLPGNSLAINSNGTLFASGCCTINIEDFYTINPDTGQGFGVSQRIINNDFFNSFTFSPFTGQLLGTLNGFPTTQLTVLDPLTAEINIIGQLPDCSDGIAFLRNFARPIPTLSEWGLIAMAGILGLVGFIAIRKRYTTA